MIDVNRLKASWVAKGKTQGEVAKALGITEKTMTLKIKKGVFGSDEIEKMIDFLDITNPSEIFFAKKVT